MPYGTLATPARGWEAIRLHELSQIDKLARGILQRAMRLPSTTQLLKNLHQTRNKLRKSGSAKCVRLLQLEN